MITHNDVLTVTNFAFMVVRAIHELPVHDHETRSARESGNGDLLHDQWAGHTRPGCRAGARADRDPDSWLVELVVHVESDLALAKQALPLHRDRPSGVRKVAAASRQAVDRRLRRHR